MVFAYCWQMMNDVCLYAGLNIAIISAEILL
jgi:hypothetical protein